ncbi:hypothetical protein BDV18DRAFT_143198 [Aspergillus unguis]
MRPALLRLLKRPSTLSVLESLLSPTFDPKHVRAQLCTVCLHRQSRIVQFSHGLPRPRRLLQRVFPHTFNRPSSSLHDRDRTILVRKRPSHWKGLGLQIEKLDYESDVGNTHDVGTRLVDDPGNRDDLDLWLELLLYRQRRYGDEGTLEIWKGLMKRVGGLHLPVDGEAADIFWQSFVDVGLKNDKFLKEIIEYSLELWKEKGNRWPNLYQSIVGWFVKNGMADRAVRWHNRLQKPHLSDPNDISHCLKAALDDYDSPRKVSCGLAPRISAFQELCKRTIGHQVYGDVIQTLISSGKTKELLRMHRFLISRGDHPRSLEELEPLLHFIHLFSSNAVKETMVLYVNQRFKDKAGVASTMKEAQKLHVQNGFHEGGFNDDFGSRIFATKALPLEMIISGLKTFGVKAIGPLSLREMGRRARGAEDILEKLDRLKNSDISVQDSVFTRLFCRFAAEDSQLLSALIHSDQHHEVLEDYRTQAKLLLSQYAAGDKRQHDLTMVVLKELLGEGYEFQTIQIQKHLSAGEESAALDVVSRMLIQGINPNRDTVNWMVNYLFGPRRPGFAPVTSRSPRTGRPLPDILRFLQGLSKAGADVRACCLWLAGHYTAPKSSIEATQNQKQTLQKIFDRHMQEAIVHWGFIPNPPTKILHEDYHATGSKGERLVPFARAMILLRELENRGVDVRIATVRRVCWQRLVMLYGKTPFRSAKKRNRTLRELNPYPFPWVLRDLNSAWGGEPLFNKSREKWLWRLLCTHYPSLTKENKKRRRNMMDKGKMTRIERHQRFERKVSAHQGHTRPRDYNVLAAL